MGKALMGLEEGIEHYIPTMPGWSSPEKCLEIAKLIRETDADISFEIGIYAGRGFLAMAMAHRDIGKGVVHGCDPWEAVACREGENDPVNDEWWDQQNYPRLYAYFVDNILQHRLLEFCNWYRFKSEAVAALFENNTISVMHQDGNHSELNSCQEVLLWDDKIVSGGYWVMDDTNWPSTTKAQSLMLDRNYTEIMDNGDWKIFKKA